MLIVMIRELRTLVSLGKGLLIILTILTLLWPVLLIEALAVEPAVIVFWIASHIGGVSAHFLQIAFVNDRVRGLLETVLVCGVPRERILIGKVAFVFCGCLLLGLFALAVVLMFNLFFQINVELISPPGLMATVVGFSLFSAVFGAWVSMVTPNPRLATFITLGVIILLLSATLTVCELAGIGRQEFYWVCAALFSGISFVSYPLAVKQFSAESLILKKV